MPKIKTGKTIQPEIYCFVTPGVEYHEGWCKIGYTDSETPEECVRSQGLRVSAPTKLEWAKPARFENSEATPFKDHIFHDFLVTVKHVKRKEDPNYKGNKKPEYFNITPDQARDYLNEFKDLPNTILKENTNALVLNQSYSLREEQEQAVNLTIDIMSKEVRKMKFDYVVGNPPYQESKNGNNHNIWPDFIKESMLISDKVCMVHPGRWAIKPKDNMKKVQNQLIELGLKSFNLFPISESCFNDVSIDGGISITLLENNYSGDITYKIDNEDKGIYNDNDMIFSNNYQEEAYNKVFRNITTNMMRYIIGRPGKYGTSGGYNKSLLADKLQDTIENLKEPIKIWASKGFGKGESKFGWYFIEKDLLIDPEPNIFKTRKVMLDSKGHAIAHGKGNVINNLPVICDRNVTGNAVFFVIPKTERERESYS